MNGRFKGKTVSENVENLPKRKLSKYEILLLSRGLKLTPTTNTVNKAKLKKLNLKHLAECFDLRGFFWNDEKEFNPDKFNTKSNFYPRNKDGTIEIYLSSIEEKFMSIEH